MMEKCLCKYIFIGERTYRGNKRHTGVVLVSRCFFFFFFFCFVSQGQDRCETSAPAPRGAGDQVRPPTRVEVRIL